MEWKPEWDAYDLGNGILKNGMLNGHIRLSDSDFELVKQWNLKMTTGEATTETERDLYSHCCAAHLMLSLTMDIPTPIKLSNTAAMYAFRTTAMENEVSTIENLSLGSISGALNTDVNMTNVKATGASYKFNSDGGVHIIPGIGNEVDTTSNQDYLYYSIMLILVVVFGVIIFAISISVSVNLQKTLKKTDEYLQACGGSTKVLSV